MAIRKRFGFLALAGLLASLLLSGCGGSSTPPIPVTATTFYAHTAVLRNFSTMTTGYNGFGQLGNGNLSTQSVLHVTAMPAGIHINQVATGGDHTLALSFDNISSVYGWGSNYHGQIGKSIATIGTTAFSDIPVKITLPYHVTDIAAGGFHSLAVAGDTGTVYAWGYDGYGQLGDNGLTDNAIPKPVQLTLGGGPLNLGPAPPIPTNPRVAAGGGHSLALSNAGQVYAWGLNAYGQLSKDPTSPVGTFSSSADLVGTTDANGVKTPLTNITQISAGGSASYALEKPEPVLDPVTGLPVVPAQFTIPAPRLWAWGLNLMGQIGIDPAATKVIAPNHDNTIIFSPHLVDTTTIVGTIEKVSAGWDHVLILVRNGGLGKVYAMGFNQFAQLGQASNLDNSLANSFNLLPVKVPGEGANKGVTDIIAFGNQSLAHVDDGTPNGVWYGWGDNSQGQLGNPIVTTTVGYLSVPTRVQGF